MVMMMMMMEAMVTWPGTVATILMSGSAEVLALGRDPDLFIKIMIMMITKITMMLIMTMIMTLSSVIKIRMMMMLMMIRRDPHLAIKMMVMVMTTMMTIVMTTIMIIMIIVETRIRRRITKVKQNGSSELWYLHTLDGFHDESKISASWKIRSVDDLNTYAHGYLPIRLDMKGSRWSSITLE